MITRPAIGDEPSCAMIASCIEEFRTKQPRLMRLRRYYEGDNDVLRRERGKGLPNNRLSHPLAWTISTLAAGYLAGRPVTYEARDARAEAPLNRILEAYRACSIDSVDAELARNASIFGKGIEHIFANEYAQPVSVALDPIRAFVVYEDSVCFRPLFGVYLTELRGEDGRQVCESAQVYTKDRCLSYTINGGKLTFAGAVPHYFGGVPMVEYWNDESEKGDFERVIGQIDAYDALQSDRLNDKQQFVDALLVLSGCTMEIDTRGRTPSQQLREDKAIVLPDSEARVEWLCKQLNEADTEILRKALKEDIHKMCMVPDLSDEHFSGVESGAALRYRLYGLELHTRTKERWFREALTERLRLFGRFMAAKGGAEIDVSGVEMRFTRALPEEEDKEV